MAERRIEWNVRDFDSCQFLANAISGMDRSHKSFIPPPPPYSPPIIMHVLHKEILEKLAYPEEKKLYFCYLFVIYNKWAEKEKGKGWSTKVFFIPSSLGSKHWLYILRSIKQLVFYHGNEWTAFCVLHSPFSKTGFNNSFRNCFDFLFIFSFKKGRNTLFSGTIFKKVK